MLKHIGIVACAIVLRPSTLLRFHQMLIKRKYHLPNRRSRSAPHPKGALRGHINQRPGCGAKEAARHFISGAATPLGKAGNVALYCRERLNLFHTSTDGVSNSDPVYRLVL